VPKRVRTQTRSYTLRLAAPTGVAEWLPLWDRLFRTHYAVCRGAAEFGELYLNLRGGLSPDLADLRDPTVAEGRWEYVRRGRRRMLALGWLSVEDKRSATTHKFRLPQVQPGQTLSDDEASSLLREVLTTKAVRDDTLQKEWIRDCIGALTARIRPDAVWVNRAAAFRKWQEEHPSCANEMAEQARIILFNMCGSDFVNLALPEDKAIDGNVDLEDSEEAEPNDEVEKGELVGEQQNPSNASRGVYSDLFGGDSVKKVARSKGKQTISAKLATFLRSRDRCCPIRDQIIQWRQENGLPPFDTVSSNPYPPEVTSSGAPTAVAKRYRKLLVSLGMWPQSNDEDGKPRQQAETRYVKSVAGELPDTKKVQVNALDLLAACDEIKESEKDNDRVFNPAWAVSIARRLSEVSGLNSTDKSATEFKRLMFAIVARRMSQTQSWIKRNEVERHKATVRRDAVLDRLRLLDLTQKAQNWLRNYEQVRGETSGAIAGYRITRRAIAECDEVIASWKDTTTGEDRDKQTAEMQARSEKFGDANLYYDLARDTLAEAVWHAPDGSPSSEILKEWVKFRQAEYDQGRLKIPRFCQPDPFHNPTWCEFGGTSKPKVWYAWNPRTRPSKPEQSGETDGSHRLWLLLPDWGKNQTLPTAFRWSSKRLWRDLGGDTIYVEEIPRADRLGVAVAGLPATARDGEMRHYRPAYPFSEDAKGWNARLQVARDALSEMERAWDEDRKQWLDGGLALKRLRWFVTFAPSLAVAEGPWGKLRAKLKWKKFPPAEVNERQKRQGSAKLILSRLPGLRILSVDLGQRFAAACAVWEALSTEEFRNECNAARAKPGFDVTVTDLYTTIAGPGERSKGASRKAQAEGRDSFRPTTLYRRIGEDFLRDNKTGKLTDGAHPAPWARLERQFLIKLQGEELPARAASQDIEMEMVERFARRVGFENADLKLPRRIDELMARTVQIARLGLERHGRRARIAHALDPQTHSVFGIGGKEIPFQQGDETHVKLLTEILFDWHALASEGKWNDVKARELWNVHVSALSVGSRIENPTSGAAADDDRTRLEKRKDDDVLRERLKPLAKVLAETDRAAMHTAWKNRWEDDDGLERDESDYEHDKKGGITKAKRQTSGWHADLRLFTDWIMGWHLPGVTSKLWTRNVGGLSLTRIGTMRSLYQVQKAFAMRARPQNPRGAPEKGESNTGVAESIRVAMERMREQRTKQIASRIVAAGLGMGGHWKHAEVWQRTPDGTREAKKKYVWVEEQSPKYKPCHAVVIEALRNYRPDELQTRRENRALMNWSANKVRKFLEEACQLHDLHLREVVPNYTSRQCSRTGLPGVRCDDVRVEEFLTAPWWRKRVKSAYNRKAKPAREHPYDAEHQMLVALDERWPECQKVPEALRTDYERKVKSANPIRLPRKGGNLFVTAIPWSCAANGHRPCSRCRSFRALQADLNAAANIGLRALLDPDFPAKWWYVPCGANDGKPAKDKVSGAVCFGLMPKFVEVSEAKRDYVNAWRDPSSRPFPDCDNKWSETSKYWNGVRSRVITTLRVFNGLVPDTSTIDA